MVSLTSLCWLSAFVTLIFQCADHYLLCHGNLAPTLWKPSAGEIKHVCKFEFSLKLLNCRRLWMKYVKKRKITTNGNMRPSVIWSMHLFHFVLWSLFWNLMVWNCINLAWSCNGKDFKTVVTNSFKLSQDSYIRHQKPSFTNIFYIIVSCSYCMLISYNAK